MIVIIQNDPGIQDEIEGFEKFGYLLKQFSLFKISCHLVMIQVGMRIDKIGVVINIEMVRCMALHGILLC
jgi:hypothetical protein